MTAANYAGLSRIPLTIAGSYFLLELPDKGHQLAAVVVAVAIVTDFLDGFLARRLGTVSTFGAILDMTTDKVFVIPMLFLVARHDAALLWMSVIIAVRDLLVTGVRMYAATQMVIVSSRPLGKLKSILLYPALLLLLLEPRSGAWMLALGTLVAVVSGLDYLRSAWQLLSPALSGCGPVSEPRPLPSADSQ